MIKVLQIIDGQTYGGIYEVMLRVEENIKDVEFNYLSPVKVYDSEKSFHLNIDRKTLRGRLIYNTRLYRFLKKHNYDIVHISSGAFFFTFFCVIICKFAKVKKIIVHSHNAPRINKLKRILIKLFNPLYRKLTDVHLACSMNAAKSLFTKTDDVIILKNGIDPDKYKFDKKIRNKYRKELNFGNKKVYGHVGRFNKQKNHEFLIDLFKEIQSREDSILLLVGTGQEEKLIKEKVCRLGLNDKVIFLGFRNDINNLLSAMDVFIFPSLYEGFGNSIIEALTSGLPTFVSDGIPEEANISGNFHRINNYDINEWKNQIINIKLKNRDKAYKDVIKSGYDIKDTSKQLENIYKNITKIK